MNGMRILTQKDMNYINLRMGAIQQMALAAVSWGDVSNKPSFAQVAYSGSYNDLSDKPSSFSGKYEDLSGKPSFSIVAKTGSYNDLTDKPIIPSITSLVELVQSLVSWRSNKAPSFGAALKTDLVTNYNILGTLIGTLVGAMNTTNQRVNEVSSRVNSIQIVLSSREITA